ncbi:MAG TPA: alkylphosphonate utilization protein [Sulfurovum sp.]|nr:alkylphosphonate utilization protein [Sulfurovum sp.]
MACDLCGNKEDLSVYNVVPRDENITICAICASSLEDPVANEKHWNCLHDSMWSTEPAVQVMAFRILSKLGAQDQLDMLYLEDDVRTWAEEDLEKDEAVPTRDSNGNLLFEGDSVSIIKDLPVKGAGFTAKQGTTVKNIRMAPGDSTHIQGRVNGTMIFLKTAFLKKL